MSAARADSGTWINPQGGSWNLSSNWANGVIANGVDFEADFSTLDLTSNATVSLNGARTITRLIFGDTTPSHDWTLATGSGGTLTPMFSLVVTVNNRTTTITSVIAGSADLYKTGPGTLVLDALNTYTGETVVHEGTLRLAANSGSSGTLRGSLKVNPGASAIASAANALGYGGSNWTRYLNVREGGTFTTTANGDQGWGLNVTLNGGTLLASGPGSRFAAGGGTNFYAGGSAITSVIDGEIRLRENNPDNLVTFGVGEGEAHPDLDFTGFISSTVSGRGIVKSGNGTMRMTGSNLMAGPANVNEGTLVVDGTLAAAQIPVSGISTLAGSGPHSGIALDYSYGLNGVADTLTVTAGATTLYETSRSFHPVSGLLLEVESGDASARYRYHGKSALLHQIAFSHDAQASFVHSRAYDELDRLTDVTHFTAGNLDDGIPMNPVAYTGYKHDELHRRTHATGLDGTYWHYGYNDRGEVTSADKKLPGGDPMAGKQYRHTFDNIGNITAKESGGDASGNNRRTFTTPANSLNQYSGYATPATFDVLGVAPATPVVQVNGVNAAYQGNHFRSQVTASNANANGDWKAVSVVAGAQSETGHRYIAPATFTPAYDLDGNLTDDGEWNYTWDAENRLTTVTRTNRAQTAGAPYRRIEFTYDAQHRCVERREYHASGGPVARTERYLYDGWNRVATLNASNQPQQRFTWGSDLSGGMQGAGGVGGLLWIEDVPTGAIHLVCMDGNGNVTALVNAATKQVTARYDYSPFGETIRQSGPYAAANPYRFSTKPQDAVTGLLYYGYRHYKPAWNTWINRDPIEEDGGVNLYGFLENNSVNHWDVLGFGKGRVVAWIAKRIDGKLVKVRPVYTDKMAARAFNQGKDVIMENGRQQAKSLAKVAIEKARRLRHDGHNLPGGKKGLPHFQDDKIPGKHIFYTGLAAAFTLAAQQEAEGKNPEECKVKVFVDAVYTDEYPGDSIASHLTVSKYVGEDSALSYLDWINPGELIAMGGNYGRNRDREAAKKLLGYNLTVVKEEDSATVQIDANGNPLGAIISGIEAPWEEVETKIGDKIFEMIGE